MIKNISGCVFVNKTLFLFLIYINVGCFFESKPKSSWYFINLDNTLVVFASGNPPGNDIRVASLLTKSIGENAVDSLVELGIDVFDAKSIIESLDNHMAILYLQDKNGQDYATLLVEKSLVVFGTTDFKTVDEVVQNHRVQ